MTKKAVSVLLIFILAFIGIVMLYSAANGSWEPWAKAQLIRFGMGFGAMMFLAFVDIRIFLRFSYLFYFVYLFL